MAARAEAGGNGDGRDKQNFLTTEDTEEHEGRLKTEIAMRKREITRPLCSFVTFVVQKFLACKLR
jgi:hypothetical protein